jgi:hypothetical protein
MQTKSSYRVLKWTFILGAMASLGSACVITSGDGDPDGEGGEGGSTAEAGTTSTTAGKGGAASAGKGGSGGSTAGTPSTPAAGAGGEGFMGGLCDADEPDPMKFIESTMFPSCAPAASDQGQDCKKCLKEECCNAWQVCYGSEPHIACGWGPNDADEPGQWDCLQNCFVDNDSDATDPDELLATCSAACTNQCEADDGGNILVATSDLIACANDPATCQAECFPF